MTEQQHGLADVLLVMGFLWRIDPSANWEERTRRLLDVVMDGLRATPATTTRRRRASSR